jgi:hypothetical protein
LYNFCAGCALLLAGSAASSFANMMIYCQFATFIFILFICIHSSIAQKQCFNGNIGELICWINGDITQSEGGAIVNAANELLKHSMARIYRSSDIVWLTSIYVDGGVAEAIVKAGGESIQRESDAIIQHMGKKFKPVKDWNTNRKYCVF